MPKKKKRPRKRVAAPKKRAKRDKNRVFDLTLPAVLLFASILTIMAFFGGVWFYLFRSGVFTIESVVINKPQGYVFSRGEDKLKRFYTGRNIFAVDLVQIEALIRNEYPQIRNVEVKRRIPNVLEVDIKYREPFAYLDTSGGIVLDREGMVLSSGKASDGAVKILGISFFFTRPSTGSRIENAMLEKALNLTEVLKKRAGLSGNDIEHIDVSNRNNLIVRIRGVDVNMGPDGFSRKIDDLSAIIRDPSVDLEEIKYIDLRFHAPVISPK